MIMKICRHCDFYNILSKLRTIVELKGIKCPLWDCWCLSQSLNWIHSLIQQCFWIKPVLCFAQFQVNGMSGSFLICWLYNTIIEDHKALFVLNEVMSPITSFFSVCLRTASRRICSITFTVIEVRKSVVPQVFLISFLKIRLIFPLF